MDSVIEILNHLETIDLISPEKSDSGLVYTFNHVFTQESVYNSLLHSDRRKLHLQIGEILESKLTDSAQGDELVLMLAYHFEQAGDGNRAFKYLGLAADNAATNYANHEARTLYQRALRLLSDDNHADRWNILSKLEIVMDRLGDRTPQVELLTQLQTLAELLHDDGRLAKTHIRRSIFFDKISEYQAAAEAAEMGRHTALRCGDEHLQAQSQNLLALAAWRRFDYRQVQHWAEKALEALRVVGNPEIRINSLFHLGKASYRLGQYDLALRYTRAAQDLAHNTDNRDGEATSHKILGWIYQRLGDYEQAEQHYQATYDVRNAIGDRYGQATALSHLGWLAADQKQSNTGLDYCQTALEMSQAISDRENEAYALSGLALNYEQLDLLDEAAARFKAAFEMHQEIGATTLAIFDLTGLARIAQAQNETKTARDTIEQVANWVLAGNAQKFWDPWIIYLSSYEILNALDDTEQAETILNEAHAVLQQRANEISDPVLRSRFMNKVETNKRLNDAWVGLHTGSSR